MFVDKRDLVNYCNIALIGLHYSSTAEIPTRGGDPTTAIATAAVIAVASVIILVTVVIAIILGAVHCVKIVVQGCYDRSSEHVREVYLYILCAVCTVSLPGSCSVCTCVCVLESQTTASLLLLFARTQFQQPPVIPPVVDCLEHVAILQLTLKVVIQLQFLLLHWRE